MSTSHLDQLRQQLSQLPQDQAEELAKWFLQTVVKRRSSASIWPGIEVTPGVCGGQPRIIRSRIPVWTLEQMRRMGMSESQILESYPTLTTADLAQAWLYAETHQEELDQQILENEVA